MRTLSLLVSTIAAIALCHSAAAIVITELVSYDMVDSGGACSTNSLKVYGVAIEGETAYFNLSQGAGDGRMTRIENISAAQTYTELLPHAAWFAASGQVNMSAYYGMGISGNYIQFAETGSDAIWRVNRTTGAILLYCDEATIANHLGQASARLLSSHCVNPTSGEHVFYEGNSDYILITAGSNVVNTLVTAQELSNAFSNSRVSGGMTYDSNGDLYWGNSESDELCMRSSAGALSVALTTGDITNHTHAGTTAGFRDIYYSPDGNIYFSESGSGSILKFEPANPSGTLATHVTRAELTNSVAGGYGLCQLDWYGSPGCLTFTMITPSYRGLYRAVPEPAMLGFAVLAIWSVFISRKRRSASQ